MITRFLRKTLAAAAGLALALIASAGAAQEPPGAPAPAAPPAAPGHGQLTAEQLAKANNPLSEMNALNLHEYWTPSIRGVPDETSNTFDLRGVVVAGRQIIRATVPLVTAPVGSGSYASGLGDISIFDAILVNGEASKTQLGVGPLLVIPSATDDHLGQGKWQAGGAVVVMHPLPGGSLLGALVTYQTDFAGDGERAHTSVMVVQPIVTVAMGGGFYFRSSAVCAFDFENSRELVPLGLGVGRAFKGLGGVVNVFLEPQFTVYSRGEGQPAYQIFTGINIQWAKKAKG